MKYICIKNWNFPDNMKNESLDKAECYTDCYLIEGNIYDVSIFATQVAYPDKPDFILYNINLNNKYITTLQSDNISEYLIELDEKRECRINNILNE